MSVRGALGRRMGACRPESTGGLSELRGMGYVDTAGDEKAEEDAEPGVAGCEEQMETGARFECMPNTENERLTAVVPIAGTAGGVARDRVATSKAQLARFALDRNRTNDRSGFLDLFVCRGVAGLAGLATRTEFVKAEGARTEMCALVEATLIADNFTGIESRATPRRRLCCVAVEAAATKVLSLLAGGVIGELYGNGSTCRGGKERGVVVGGEGGGIAELGGNDKGSVLELDRLGVGAVGKSVVVDGVLVIVLGLGEVVTDVREGGTTWHGVRVQVVLLLVVVPFGVVGGVVDVNVLGVVVVGVLFVELL